MKKGLSSLIVVVGIVFFVIVGSSLYYFFSQGGDFFLVICNKSRKELEKAVSVYSVSDDIQNIQGVLNEEKIEKLREFFSQNFDNPECKQGGTFFITNTGKIFCSLHGYGDRIPQDSKDFLDFPEDEIIIEKDDKKKKEKERKRKELEYYNQEIDFTAEDKKLYSDGVSLIRSGQIFDGIGKIQEAIALNSEELKYYEALIYAYKKIKQLDKVKKYCDFYLSKNPGNKNIIKVYDYVKTKEYFDLRLKKLIDKNKRIVFLSNSGSIGSFDSIDLNGDNQRRIISEISYLDYTIGDNNRIYYVKDDNILYKDLLTGKVNTIFNNSDYRIFNLFYSKFNQKLFFSSMKQSRGYEIYSVTTQGNELLKITQNEEDDFLYDFSPDGKNIVYVNGDMYSQDIAISDLNGIKKNKIAKGILREEYPDWAPTRKMIAYSSNKTVKDINGESQRDLFLYNTDTEKTVNITESRDMDETYPNWSGKNDRIAYSAVDLNTGFFEIYVMNADGTGKVKLTDFRQPLSRGWNYYYKFQWLENDSLLIFSAGFENSLNLYIAEIETGKVLQLTDDYNSNIKASILELDDSLKF